MASPGHKPTVSGTSGAPGPPRFSSSSDKSPDLGTLLETIFKPRGFADDVPMAVVAMDPDLRVAGWNVEAERMFGWTAREMVGTDDWIQAVIPAAREPVTDILRDMASGGEPVHNTHDNLTRGGRRIVCEWHYAPVRMADGTVVGVVALARDVTQQHRSEREKARLRDIAALANAARDRDEILLLIRSAVLDAGGFDRAGVWLYDGEALLGSWGTDMGGCIRDEHGAIVGPGNFSPGLLDVVQGRRAYALSDSSLMTVQRAGEVMTAENPLFAVIGLFAHGSIIGAVFCDNAITSAAISDSEVAALLPFCEQVAVALSNAQFMEERARMAERQQRLMEISAAINRSLELEEVLHMVRNAIVSAGGFERAGVFRLEHGVIYGAWGTDRDGGEKDERDFQVRVSASNPYIQTLVCSGDRYVLEDAHVVPTPERPEPTRIRRAIIALRAAGEIVGIVSVDNLLSGKPATGESVEALLPFCEQAAVAIRNAQLIRERGRTLERQQRLLEISAAINRSVGLDELLRLVRNAIVDARLFDRVGVWTVSGGSIHGAWGSDDEGGLRDERNIHEKQETWGPHIDALVSGELTYYLEEWVPTDEVSAIPAIPIPHAVLALRTSGALVGLLSVDNLLTGRPILDEDVEALLPFAEQAAVAIRNAQLQVERERLIERQRRLATLAAAISARTELNAILRMVRDAIVEVAGFDRAGVFLYNGLRQRLEGAWGTSRGGEVESIASLVHPMESDSPYGLWKVVRGETDYVLSTDMTAEYCLAEDHPLHGVHHHATVAMNAAGEIVGVIVVDNLLTDRPINEDDVAVLLPFAEQAAVAIQNARLWEERERLAERQRRLANLSSAINGRTDLNAILRMVRDAAVETAGFDRAGVFLYDLESSALRGTWGTDLEGQPEDITYQSSEVPGNDVRPVTRLLTSNSLYLITDDYARDLQVPPGDEMYAVHAHAVVKLTSDGETLGVLSVDNAVTDRPIKEEEVQILLPFANQAAVAIQNARLFEQLHKTQEALVRAERLRALGELAGGVAHNINNLLTAVLGYSELIQQEPDVSANIAHYARIIERAGLDGAEIVRRVRQFAQNEAAASMEPFDLARMLREALDLTRPLWRTHAEARGAAVEIESHIPAELRAVGIATEIREVVVNLIKNALEAMPEGGTLELWCRADAEYAVIEVADSGMGMDEATRKRVFEPFFTTKGVGIGTGLGLSLAWGIIRRHNGRIEVESAPGAGSRFRIHLPLAPKAAVVEEATGDDAPILLHGVRILLVEDEDVVAESLARLLIARGATVALAESGEEALAWLREHAGICDIVVSDHGMPGMTGLDLLSRVRTSYPQLRRMLVSGWGASPPGASDTSAAERLLAKPIPHRELLRALQELASPVVAG